MIIYIAGPITGVEDYRERFGRVEAKLKAKGHLVLNPARLPAGLEYEHYMKIDLAMLEVADAVCGLCGWEENPGASIEVALAQSLGKYLIFEREDA